MEKKGSGGGGGDASALGNFWVYYQNNALLGMFQLKFCLKTFETCSLLRLYT